MISMIVAYSKNNKVIGKNNQIPWHISEDFKHFKSYTLHKTILMGKNTYFSIGKPLKERKTIIVVNDAILNIKHEDVQIENDLFAVLKRYQKSQEELVVCGGATIYKLALPYANQLIISELKQQYEGDAYFPDFENDFDLVNVDEREAFFIKTYLRKRVK